MKFRKLLYTVTMLFIMTACGNTDNQEDIQGHDEEDPGIETMSAQEDSDESLIVSLVNTSGDRIGDAVLEQRQEGVYITLEATELTPGIHGFHVHEVGKCQPPTFGSAEGHFNPMEASHGFDHPEGPHAGDLPNIKVAEDGTVKAEVLAEKVTLEEGKENSLRKDGGTALMIHSGADDYKSQPAGDAGERVACGVIAE
ncbi:superoxide dismutase, Cu-Zn family [Oceanobacillus limi]|uniref:Superoxide dismutase [Cu-Zn] n=1 Tax=Oceanobacillus limi TaxID=930131 RepID=A0A1I0EZ59_9BACI|nr:superoxide dismutase family protein [Oceanobacillus limi]SET50965.1 superoxide dismutase, Cu-Zn family [Oceanobacillus limi]